MRGLSFCSVHVAIKCSNCRTTPATHECSVANQFACNNPLCDACGHDCPSHFKDRAPVKPAPKTTIDDPWHDHASLNSDEFNSIHTLTQPAFNEFVERFAGRLAAINGDDGVMFQPSARGREMANELEMMRARYVLGLEVRRTQAELEAIAVAADAVESATSPNDPLAKLLRHLSAGLKP
jgi:hypothetical protein